MHTDRPNVLFITADQLRADFVGCYGQKFIHTPAIDSLARDGTLFEQCFVQHTKCTPSRCSFFTGRYPHTDGHRTLFTPLLRGEPHLGTLFKSVGYTTALFGKNHIVEKDCLPESFDHFSALEHGDNGYSFVDSTQALYRAFYRGKLRVTADETCDGRLCKQAEEYLLEHSRAADRPPFFAWVSFEFPHPPFCVPEPYFSMYERSERTPRPIDSLRTGKPRFMDLIHKVYRLNELTTEQWRELVAVYCGMVSMVDAFVARLLKRLDDTGQAENTIVLFQSDHGEFLGDFGVIEKWDTAFYENLLHVPFLLRGPGIPNGARATGLVEAIDMAPTLLDLCGIEIPREVHGRTLRPVLDHPGAPFKEAVFAVGGWEDTLKPSFRNADKPDGLYWGKSEVLALDRATLNRAVCVRTSEWKLVYRPRNTSELYHLYADPQELTNRFDDPACSEIRSKLIEKLLTWQIDTQSERPYDPAARA